MTTEKKLEKSLFDWAKRTGGIALKGDTNFDTGYPDRIVYVPGAYAHAEIKGSSKRYHLTDKQKLWAGRIIASRAPYFIIESEQALEDFKRDVYRKPHEYKEHMYRLNGFKLLLVLSKDFGRYEVHSHNGDTPVRLMSGLMSDSLPNTIYRIFVALEEMFPNTNYEDM